MELAASIRVEARDSAEELVGVRVAGISVTPWQNGTVFTTYKAARTHDEQRAVIQQFAEGYGLDWHKIRFNACLEGKNRPTTYCLDSIAADKQSRGVQLISKKPRKQDIESLLQRCDSLLQLLHSELERRPRRSNDAAGHATCRQYELERLR